MDKLIKRMTDYYIKKDHIPKEDRKVYEYGFHLIFSDIINFSMILILGALLHQLVSSIVFLVTLCSVRQFTGGFHAKKYWICRTAMIITFLSVIIASVITTEYRHLQFVCILLNILDIILICIFAPIEHINKPLDSMQKKTNKQRAIILSALFSMASIILIIMDIHIGIVISNTLSSVVVLMVVALIINKKGEKRDVCMV